MKSALFIVALCAVAIAADAQTGGFRGPGTDNHVTVARAAQLRDDRTVRLEGWIVESAGDETYRFRDDTGSILVEIDDEVWNGLEVTPELAVEIAGEVDRDFRRVAVDVDTVRRKASALTAACLTDGPARPLPAAVRESSGLAASRLRPGVLWTHNDRGNEPMLFAVDGNGTLLQSLRLDVPAVDWEDLAVGQCGDASCLYVGDIGDNDGEREQVTIYRLAEPAAGAAGADAVTALHARFPDGPRDAESLFVLPTGDLYLLTKGRREDIVLYRYPAPERPGEIVTLERVRELFAEPADGDDRVTAASASPDGSRVGIRTGTRLYLYASEALVSDLPLDPTIVDLRSLGERQGEGLALAGDGAVWLSSEAGNRDSAPMLNRLTCPLP